MSMQPMFAIQSSASSSFTIGASIHRACGGRSRVETSHAEPRDPLRHVRRRVLLEERLAEGAVGIAAHRERPVAQMRHEHGRDCAVVVEQVALRDALVRPEDLVEIRELDAALRRRGGLLASHGLRRLVRRAVPGTTARAGARRASTRRTPPRRRASAPPTRRRPCEPSASSARPGTATSSRRSGSSFASSSSMSRSVKPVPQLPTHSSSLPRWTPSTSEPNLPLRWPWPFVQPQIDELLPTVRLDLQPVAAALALEVARRTALGHHALEALLARRLVAAPRRRRRRRRSGRLLVRVEQLLEPFARRSVQRQVEHRHAVELEHVEDLVDDRRVGLPLLHRREARPSRPRRARTPRRRRRSRECAAPSRAPSRRLRIARSDRCRCARRARASPPRT